MDCSRLATESIWSPYNRVTKKPKVLRGIYHPESIHKHTGQAIDEGKKPGHTGTHPYGETAAPSWDGQPTYLTFTESVELDHAIAQTRHKIAGRYQRACGKRILAKGQLPRRLSKGDSTFALGRQSRVQRTQHDHSCLFLTEEALVIANAHRCPSTLTVSWSLQELLQRCQDYSLS